MGKKNEPFPYKALLIFSGVCWSVSILFFYILGSTLKIVDTFEYNIYGFLIIIVPFATHLYLWGKFCEWKKIQVLPYILKILAILYVIGVIVGVFVYLFQL